MRQDRAVPRSCAGGIVPAATLSMHRFHLPPEQCQGMNLSLRDREAHHALQVLRVQRGDRAWVLDGAGRELLCEVLDGHHDEVRLTVIERRSVPALPFQLTLLQAVPKGKLIEAIIQKATELGVYRIVPLLSERVTTRLDHESAGQKAARWRLIAIEAIKQCGSAWLPQVEPPVTPDAFLARKETFDLPLIASLQPGSRHAREYFRAFQTERQRHPRSVCIWVGPEGDFTPAEVAAIESAGTLPITLGRLVLRSDTAAVYCLSILNHELQSAS
jgi:16S rRNA (uracil1498-N3)-methyltransferase